MEWVWVGLGRVGEEEDELLSSSSSSSSSNRRSLSVNQQSKPGRCCYLPGVLYSTHYQ